MTTLSVLPLAWFSGELRLLGGAEVGEVGLGGAGGGFGVGGLGGDQKGEISRKGNSEYRPVHVVPHEFGVSIGWLAKVYGVITFLWEHPREIEACLEDERCAHARFMADYLPPEMLDAKPASKSLFKPAPI